MCRFAFFVGCRTGLPNTSGASLLEAACERGADCAAGFCEAMERWAVREGVPELWRYTMSEGYTVDAAAIQVRYDFERKYGTSGGWDSYVSPGNVSLAPARWGD